MARHARSVSAALLSFADAFTRLRNKAEASVAGVAARLLAQLDGDYASAGHLAPSCAALRQDLLQAMLSGEQGTLVPLIEQGRKL